MKEYEVRDLGASMTSNIIQMAGMQGDYIAIYISVVFAFIAASYVAGREFNFMREINQVDLTSAFKAADTHVLAIHGEADIAAIDEEWAMYTADMVNSFYPGKGKWLLLKETEHSFAKVGPMSEYMQRRNSGELDGPTLESLFNHELIEVVATWMDELVKPM